MPEAVVSQAFQSSSVPIRSCPPTVYFLLCAKNSMCAPPYHEHMIKRAKEVMKAIISGETIMKLCPEHLLEKWNAQVNAGWIQLAIYSLGKDFRIRSCWRVMLPSKLFMGLRVILFFFLRRSCKYFLIVIVSIDLFCFHIGFFLYERSSVCKSSVFTPRHKPN